MKNPAPKTVGLMQAVSDTLASRRRLAARIAAACLTAVVSIPGFLPSADCWTKFGVFAE
jgi:hypothetical protein